MIAREHYLAASAPLSLLHIYGKSLIIREPSQVTHFPWGTHWKELEQKKEARLAGESENKVEKQSRKLKEGEGSSTQCSQAAILAKSF